MTDDDLSPAEREFRALLSRPADYARWAARVRREWLRRHRPSTPEPTPPTPEREDPHG